MEIVTTRTVPAPRERVFAAFPDAEALAVWWGPAGFRNTFHEFDFRPGGAWRFTMHAPDGSDYEMAMHVVDVVPSERIAFRNPQPGHAFVSTFTLHDAPGGGTRIEWVMRFDDADECERVRAFVEPANEQNLDRLEAHLASGSPDA